MNDESAPLEERFRQLLSGEVKGYAATAWRELAVVAHEFYTSACECDHESLSGDEGPMAELGRWPARWRCDGCGAILKGSANA